MAYGELWARLQGAVHVNHSFRLEEVSQASIPFLPAAITGALREVQAPPFVLQAWVLVVLCCVD